MLLHFHHLSPLVANISLSLSPVCVWFDFVPKPYRNSILRKLKKKKILFFVTDGK